MNTNPLLALVLALSFVLTACGGGGTDTSVPAAESGSQSPGEVQPPSTEVPDAQPVVPTPPVTPSEPAVPPTTPPVEPPAPPPVTPPVPPAPQAPGVVSRLSLSYGIKSYTFDWSSVPSATFYRLGSSPYPSSSGFDFNIEVGHIDGTTHLIRDIELIAKSGGLSTKNYAVQACNSLGCGPWSASVLEEANRAVGYLKSSSTVQAEQLGSAVAISGDGKTMALGAPEYSDAAGRVIVYTNRAGKGWLPSDTLSIALPSAGDRFGQAVALSDDGNTLAVGVPGIFQQGVVMVYRRMKSNGQSYFAQYKSLPSNTALGNETGTSVAISADGKIVAFGAPGQDSGAGAVYVADLDVASLPVALRPPVTSVGTRFGEKLDLSDDGKTLIVGRGRDGGMASSGLIFRGSSLQWQNTDSLKDLNAWMPLGFVPSVAISGDGTRAAVGDIRAVSMFFRMDAGNYVLTSSHSRDDYVGGALSFANGGKRLLVGRASSRIRGEGVWASPETDPTLTSKPGAVEILDETGDHTWGATRVIGATNPEDGDAFGTAVGISADGKTILVGAPKEASNATAINGEQADNSQPGAGAAYLY